MGALVPNKITLVIPSMGVGGAERVMSILANEWAAKGNKVQLVTFQTANTDFYPLNQSIERISLDLSMPSNSIFQAVLNNYRRVARLRKTITHFRPDAVISFTPETNILTLIAAAGTRAPVLISERSDPSMRKQKTIWNMLRRLIYPRASAVVVQTERVRHWINQQIPSASCHVIPNPVRPLRTPRKNAPTPSANSIVAMGRLVEAKGFDLLLKAFANLEVPDCRLFLIGDGPERENLHRLAETLDVIKRVTFLGALTQPDKVLRSATLFVLSSRYEGFPNALLEAMSLGVPSVSFDCPSGPSDIITHGKDGFLVPQGDVQALSNALTHLLKHPKEREAMGLAASASIKKRFSVPIIMNKWDSLVSLCKAS